METCGCNNQGGCGFDTDMILWVLIIIVIVSCCKGNNGSNGCGCCCNG